MSNPNKNGTPEATSIKIQATGPSTSGGIAVYLEYRLTIEGQDVPVADDTDYVPRQPPGAEQPFISSDYRKFTGHKPTSTQFIEKFVAVNERGEEPPYTFGENYYYRVKDQYDVRMPGVWVQERFPDGFIDHYNDPPPDGPTEVLGDFAWNGSNPQNPIYWVTDANGVFNAPDSLIMTWPFYWDKPEHTDPGYGPLRHEYRGGTKDIETGGCYIGTYYIRMWTNDTTHDGM